MKCIQKKYLLLLGCIATLALQSMNTPNASLNHANAITQKPLAKEAATLQKQLTYLVDCGYVEQIKQIFATIPAHLKKHKQDLVHNLIAHAEKLKAKKTAQVEQLKNRKMPRVHSWTSAIEGTLRTMLAGIPAFKVYHYLNKIYKDHTGTSGWHNTKQNYKTGDWYTVKEKSVERQKRIKKFGGLSVFFLGVCYFFTKGALAHFKKALTYRHELEKEVVVLDVIINYLKSDITQLTVKSF